MIERMLPVGPGRTECRIFLTSSEASFLDDLDMNRHLYVKDHIKNSSNDPYLHMMRQFPKVHTPFFKG